MSAYALMLEGSSLSALVVGGGNVATRKIRALLDAGARVRVLAPEIASEIREWARNTPSLEISSATYDVGGLGDALLVIAATSDAELNARITAEARAAGRLANDASDPDGGNCSTPAVHRAGDVVIAVSTGRLPPAAARIRDSIAGRVDLRYSAAVRELSLLRRALLDAGRRDRWHEAAATLVGADFCADVEAGRFASRLAAWR